MGEYFAFTEGIRGKGQLVAGEALHPTQTATTVRVRNGKISTTDGPYVETKEQLGGFYLVEAAGSERSHSDRLANSVGAVRRSRSAARGGLLEGDGAAGAGGSGGQGVSQSPGPFSSS